MFKLGSVIFSNALKEVSSAQQGCIYLYKKHKPDSRRGVSKMAKKYYFTNLLIESKLCFVGIMSDRMYKHIQC